MCQGGTLLPQGGTLMLWGCFLMSLAAAASVPGNCTSFPIPPVATAILLLNNQRAQGCQTSSCQQAAALAEEAPLAATAGSDYQRNRQAAGQGRGCSGSPGNCSHPGEQGACPALGMPAQP